MGLTMTLHLVAGLGALGMGGGILLREPGRARNRTFALLCVALSLWNLGRVGALMQPEHRDFWRPLFLLGSCAAAPLGLDFSLVLTGAATRVRHRLLPLAALLAAALWASSFLLYSRLAWALATWIVLGGILGLALTLVGLRAFRLPLGPERRALQLIFWGGVVGAVGGLSDFMPRTSWNIPNIGPIAVLIFLLFVCAWIVRHRFLDVDVFLIRAVALIAGAATIALIYFGVVRLFDQRFVTLLLTSLFVVAAVGPLGRVLLTRAHTLLTPEDPLAKAILEVSAELPRAKTAEEVWQTIERGRLKLPTDVRIDVYLRHRNQKRFHLTFRSGGAPDADGAPLAWNALTRLLDEERLPVTLRYLEQEMRDAGPARRREAEQALETFRAFDMRLVAPLVTRKRLIGFISAAGGLAGQEITAEAATAFLAVGNQAAASLDRIAAIDSAKRREALATAGELSAGLAHEVRNPLAAIRGAAQALGPTATPDQEKEMLEVIAEETDRLDRVVGEFLHYARPGPPQRASVDLASLVQRVIRMQELAGKKLATEVHVDNDAPSAWGDADQLQRALENLVRNAWEAAGDGCRLEIEIYPAGEDEVAIRFQDNGPGIELDAVSDLFKPFYTKRTGGSGLGLALVHRIVETHGGNIFVDGRPGLGAAFTLLLPAAPRGAER